MATSDHRVLSPSTLPYAVSIGFTYRDRNGGQHAVGVSQTFRAASEHHARHLYNVACAAMNDQGAPEVGGETAQQIRGITIDPTRRGWSDNARNHAAKPKTDALEAVLEGLFADIFGPRVNVVEFVRDAPPKPPVNPFMLDAGYNNQLQVCGRFWMVVNCDVVETNQPHPADVYDKARVNGPNIAHSTRMGAEEEAKRLAEANPGVRFAVVEAVSDAVAIEKRTHEVATSKL